MKTLYDCSDFLLCMAVGDAYCMAAEYVDPDHPVVEEALKFERYLLHPVWGARADSSLSRTRTGVAAGCYTDDTQMTLAVTESLLAYRPSAFEMAESFLRVYQRDPRAGYAYRFQRLLIESNGDAHAFVTWLHGQNFSEKNGAAMRSIPFGVLVDQGRISGLERAEACAALTHLSPAGRLSARAVASMAYQALYTELPFGEFSSALAMDRAFREYPTEPSRERVDIDTKNERNNAGPNSVAWKTVRAVLHVLSIAKTLREAMEVTLHMGGDTDTVAALSCGLLGLRGVKPEPWMVLGLEPNSRFGAGYLQQLGKRVQAACDCIVSGHRW